jgi:hypothetical protein
MAQSPVEESMEMDRANIQPNHRKRRLREAYDAPLEKMPKMDEEATSSEPKEDWYESAIKNWHMWTDKERELIKDMNKRQLVHYVTNQSRYSRKTSSLSNDEYLSEEDLNEVILDFLYLL